MRALRASLLLATALPSLAGAGAWQQGAGLTAAGEYDSNPEYAPADREGLWRARMTPRYSLLWSDGRNAVEGAGALLLERSSDSARSMTRADPSGTLGWNRTLVRGGLGVEARYAEAAIRDVELDESGLVEVDGTRTSKGVAGHWDWSVTDRAALRADAGYRQVGYDTQNLTDYTEDSGALRLSYTLGPRTRSFTQLGVREYRPRGRPGHASLYSAEVGLEREQTDRLGWTLQGGLNRRVAREEEDKSGWQGEAALEYRFARASVAMSGGRTAKASGAGGFVEADHLTAAWQLAVDERTGLGVTLGRREVRGDAPVSTDQIGVWATRQLSPVWTLRGSYTLMQREAGEDATRQLMMMSLAYGNTWF